MLDSYEILLHSIQVTKRIHWSQKKSLMICYQHLTVLKREIFLKNIEVCCRDPNYVDPWPQNMPMGMGMF